MKNYLKYEIKENYKIVLVILALVCVLTTALGALDLKSKPLFEKQDEVYNIISDIAEKKTKSHKEEYKEEYKNDEEKYNTVYSNKYTEIHDEEYTKDHKLKSGEIVKADMIDMEVNDYNSAIVLLRGGLIGLAVVTMLFLINLFRKELYNDRGYLTFTLPIKGKDIVAGKLIFAFGTIMSMNLVFLIILSVFSNIRASNLEFSLIGRYSVIYDFINMDLMLVLNALILLLLSYLALSISKTKNKLLEKMSVPIFIGEFIIFMVISRIVMKISPFLIDFKKLDIIKKLPSEKYFQDMWLLVTVSDSTENVYFNILNLIFYIVVGVGLFIGISKILDKKINL